MGWDFQSPWLSAGPHVSIIAAPLPVGAHRSIRHHPVEWESKLKPWIWKLHTWGSFCLIGSASPGSSWIFTVPLNPFALLLLLPPVAAAGLDAANTRRARPVMKVRTPDALRIGASCGGFAWPHVGRLLRSEAGSAPMEGKRVTHRQSAMPKSVTRCRRLDDSKRVVVLFLERREFLMKQPLPFGTPARAVSNRGRHGPYSGKNERREPVAGLPSRGLRHRRGYS
jgi:hypothetical protein